MYDDPLMASEVEGRVREVLEMWMKLYPKIYSDGWMTGLPLGVLQVGIVVTRRDQWMAGIAARRFARALALRARVHAKEVRLPDQDTLPPHTNRGHKAAFVILDEVPRGS